MNDYNKHRLFIVLLATTLFASFANCANDSNPETTPVAEAPLGLFVPLVIVFAIALVVILIEIVLSVVTSQMRLFAFASIALALCELIYLIVIRSIVENFCISYFFVSLLVETSYGVFTFAFLFTVNTYHKNNREIIPEPPSQKIFSSLHGLLMIGAIVFSLIAIFLGISFGLRIKQLSFALTSELFRVLSSCASFSCFYVFFYIHNEDMRNLIGFSLFPLLRILYSFADTVTKPTIDTLTWAVCFILTDLFPVLMSAFGIYTKRNHFYPNGRLLHEMNEGLISQTNTQIEPVICKEPNIESSSEEDVDGDMYNSLIDTKIVSFQKEDF